MANDVTIVLKAVDKASAEIKKVSGASSKLADGFKYVTGFSLGAAGAIGLATAALNKIYEYSKVAIAAASDLAETESKIGVVFDDQADSMIAWGQDAAEAMGMSSNAALAAAGTYGNLFRAMGIGSETSADMSKTLVQLASDLASFNNMDPTMVLDKLRAGLSGETEPLKSLGVNLNQALIQQEALNLGIWDGVGAIDAAQKAQASYSLIMQQTSLAQGDFERTSEGLANQQRILQAASEDLAAAYGETLLPAQTEWVKFQVEVVQGLNKTIGVIADNETALARLGIEQSRTGGYIKDGKRISAEYVHEAVRAQRANDAWSASLNAQADAYLKLHPEMAIAIADYSAVADELIPLNAYMSELTTQLIFQQAAAGLDAEAQFALAEAMGLISPNTKMAMEAITGFKGDLAETGDIDTYISRVDTLNDAMAKITDKNVSINIGINYGGEMGGVGGAEIASGVDLNGNGIIGKATGGLGGGYTLVGERGPEVVNLPSGSRVYSNTQSNQMASGAAGIDYDRMGRALVNALVTSGYIR